MASLKSLRLSAFPALLTLIAVGASAAGGVAAWLTRGGTPESAAGVSAAMTSGVQEGDPRISYPGTLSSLPVPPSHLAVKEDGTLWFLLFEDGGAGTPALYSYDPARDSLNRFVLPESYGSMLFSAIEIAPSGHVVSAYGHVVVDFDPVTGAQKEIRLPDPSANFFELEPPEDSWITDMAIDEQGKVLLGRSRTSSVTVVDLEVGSVTEIALPKSFGSAKEIAVGKSGIYVSNVYGDPGIERQAGLLSLDGAFVSLPLTANALAAGQEGVVYAASIADGELYILDGVGASRIDASQPIVSGVSDQLSWDGKSKRVWIAGEGIASIGRLDPVSGVLDTFSLPVYKNVLPRCPVDLPCSPAEVYTRVGGLAVAPDGSVYFSDMTLSRIGVIKAGQ